MRGILDKYQGVVTLERARRLGNAEIIELLPEAFKPVEEPKPGKPASDKPKSSTMREWWIRSVMARKKIPRSQAEIEWKQSQREQEEQIRQAKRRERGQPIPPAKKTVPTVGTP